MLPNNISSYCNFIFLVYGSYYVKVTSTCIFLFVDIFRRRLMAGKAESSMAKAVAECQYLWREKLAKYKDELLLTKGVVGLLGVRGLEAAWHHGRARLAI